MKMQKLHMNKVQFSFLSFWSMLIVIRWCLLCVSYKRTFATWKILECRPTRLHLSIFSIIVNVNQISLLGEVTSDYIQLQEYHIDMEDGRWTSLSLSLYFSVNSFLDRHFYVNVCVWFVWRARKLSNKKKNPLHFRFGLGHWERKQSHREDDKTRARDKQRTERIARTHSRLARRHHST